MQFDLIVAVRGGAKDQRVLVEDAVVLGDSAVIRVRVALTDKVHILVDEEGLSVRGRGDDRQREVRQPISGEGQVLVVGSQGADLILADGRDEDRVVDTLFRQLHEDRDIRNERSFLVLRVLFNQIYELRVVHVTATVTVPTNPVEMRSLGVRSVSYACAPPMGLKPHWIIRLPFAPWLPGAKKVLSGRALRSA